MRYGLAALLLSPWAIRRSIWRRGARALSGTAFIGFGILCLPQWLIFVSAPHLPPALPVIALAIVPVLLAIAGRIGLSTAMCGLAGALFLIGNGVSLTAREMPWLLLPAAAAAILAWALATADKRLRSMTVVEALFVQCMAAAAFFAVCSRAAPPDPMRWSGTAFAVFALTACGATVGGYLLFYALLRQYGAGRISTLQWAQTLVATTESAVLLRVRPSWEGYLGALLIVVGLVMALSQEREGGVMLEITRR
ncbi:MAG: Permease of the drug/metabolite transporter superfamily [Acidobacteriaceae bacterium]|nr:Permease of the drug/metabolite transporter superfamily [Acidobacteriaceae bacterium]